MTGCLQSRPDGHYALTDVRDRRHLEHGSYALVTTENLSKRVGHRVEIKGKAVEDGHGTLAVESKTRTEVENGKDRETKMKAEGTTGALDLPYLGVRSVKTLSSSCR